MIAAASLLANETVTIGAGGSGGASWPDSGNNGSTTSFGAHCSATGGEGGGALGGSPAYAGLAAIGGVGSGGNINYRGAPGPMGFGIYGSYPVSYAGGNGGGPLGGAGARGRGGEPISAFTGENAGANTGGGGSGGVGLYNNSTPVGSGGNGGSGKCVVWEFG